ncbi:autotransporter domain-containing protein [Azospirillum sp. YIM B02556]|uniref:Autotransporter domain-containing protein n=1 Tax=Azospirillum endophyticum TaxID=2800326 RepID=A0ABS1FHI0_9PROT|nr:autotransporter outer membrane beta-barrel domain-containing protein [Azospirillum endophyticum]MBK1842901.1 autotransporter domain-containing protein [Azospirillum endophyticum]
MSNQILNGILLDQGGYVENSGTLTSANGVTVRIGGAGTFVNSGSLLSSNDSGVSMGGAGVVTNDSYLEAAVTGVVLDAGGTVTNSGRLIGGTTGVVLSAGGTVINHGTITNRNGNPFTGVSLSAGGTVVNYGTIKGANGGSAVQFSATGGTLKLETGSVLIGTVVGGGNGSLVLEGTGTLPNTVTGMADLSMAGTSWTLSGSATAASTTLQSGSLLVTGALISSGGVQVGSGATLGGAAGTVTGDVTVQSGGTLRPGSSGAPGTLTITGNYTQQSGGTLAIANTATTSSTVAVTGTATLNGALSLASDAGTYTNKNFVILTAGNGVTGSFSSVTDSQADVTPTVTFDTANNRLQVVLNTVSPSPPPPPSPPSPPPPPPPPVVVSPPVSPPPPPVVVSPSPPPPPPPGVIDGSQPSFGNSDSVLQSNPLVFAGGTLKPTSPLLLSQPLTIMANGGFITPNRSSVTLTGPVSGSGTLTVSGAGTVTIGGTVSNGGGLSVRDGSTLALDGGSQVSAPILLAGGSTATVGGTVSGSLTVEGNSGLTVAGGGTVTGALTVASGSATVGGVVAAPVSVAGGGSLTVVQGGGVGGTVTASGGSVLVAANGIINGAVTASNGAGITVDGAIMAPVTVSGSTLTVNGGGGTGAVTVGGGGSVTVNGTVSGSVTAASGSALGGGGTILGDAAVAGTLSPGNSPGVLTVGGSVTLAGTSVYRAEIDGPTAGTGAGHHDRVAVQGGFTAAGTLTPVLRGIGGDASNGYTATLGRSYAIVTAAGGVLGAFDRLVQPAEGLAANTRFDVLYDADSIRLTVTPDRYAAMPGATRNRSAVGSAVDAIRPAAGMRLSGPLTPLFSGLYGLDADGTAGALDRLSGRLHADTLAADLANRRLMGQVVAGRLASMRGEAVPTGGISLGGGSGNAVAVGVSGTERPAGNGGGGVWGLPLAAYGRTGSDGNAGGRSERIGGFLVGADHAYEGGVTAGLAIGYLRNRLSAQDGLGKATVDSYQATLYGSWEVMGYPGPYVEGGLGYGYTRYDSDRSLSFGGFSQAATAKAGGHDLSAELAAGHRMALGDEAWIEPRAGLRVDRITRAAFDEEGGAAALGVDAAAWTSLRSTIGLRGGTSLTVGGWTLRPEASLAWGHDFADVTATTTNRLAGAAFTADASKPGHDAALLGAGVGFALKDGVNAGVSVQDELRDRGNSLSVSAGLKWRL